MQEDRFEAFSQAMHGRREAGHFRDALLDVADTADACKRWFEGAGLSATAADVLEMTKLVLAREAMLKAMGQPPEQD
jgi:hypothetical protein